jgi:hypothetical protein
MGIAILVSVSGIPCLKLSRLRKVKEGRELGKELVAGIGSELMQVSGPMPLQWEQIMTLELESMGTTASSADSIVSWPFEGSFAIDPLAIEVDGVEELLMLVFLSVTFNGFFQGHPFIFSYTS